MTIEEKAKAYDEAIERAKYYYNEGKTLEYATDVASYIFPELKESEDERVRKELIDAVQGLWDDDALPMPLSVKRKNEWLAWLEKQSEQKPVGEAKPKFKVKYAGSEYNVFETKDIAGVTFYGIEDEPNHIDYVKAENCEIISGYAIKENGSQYPTKPAVFSEKSHA